MFLDAIFHLPARAVVVAVKVSGRDLVRAEGGDDKMAKGTVAIVGELADHSTLPTPRIQGAIAQGLIPHLRRHQPVKFASQLDTALAEQRFEGRGNASSLQICGYPFQVKAGLAFRQALLAI
jgi:hypothetical protein